MAQEQEDQCAVSVVDACVTVHVQKRSSVLLFTGARVAAQAIVAEGLYHPVINDSIALRMSVSEPPAKYPTADLQAEVRPGAWPSSSTASDGQAIPANWGTGADSLVR